MKRTALPRSKDTKVFRQTARKTRAINLKIFKRGGIRL